MKLVKARVQGFQSFGDSGEIEFSDGINLIIGQNNAGKSAFMRALLPNIPDDRHRTPDKWESYSLGLPTITITVDVSGAEIRDWFLRSGERNYFPVTIYQFQNTTKFIKEIFEKQSLELCITRHPNGEFFSSYPLYQMSRNDSTVQPGQHALITSVDGELEIVPTQISANNDSLPKLLGHAWRRDMFYFAAERMTIGVSALQYQDRLESNASNLPNVLHLLSSDRRNVFMRLVGHLREIFPTVGNLSVGIRPNNSLEVRVWPTESQEHVELSFPLNASGTGVSQVIALLTAIMTVSNAVIMIDEINSFLHPAAVKALLRILQTQYTQHQYIISTHAPEVIAFSNPRTIHLVKRAGYKSSIERLDLSKIGKFREIAEHLGVSMSDVFAAERVIWVEGPTEELCFPYIYQALVNPLPRGMIFISVIATGDFNTKKRDKAMVYDIYKRLTTSTDTLVVSVAFSFDTEKLTETEKNKMQREAGGLLHFLPRRHLECYLINPEAIAAFIISKDPSLAQAVTSVSVEVALQNAAAQQPFFIPEWKGNINESCWLARIDAAALILNVCGTLSEQKAPFAKKNDSLFLLRYIIEHNSKHLIPLRDYVKTLVEAVSPN